MAWLQVHQTIKDHRKTFDSADALGIEPSHMIGLIVSFWLWALDNAPLGDLEGISNRTIARAAGWPDSDADHFVECIEAAGWLDSDNNGRLTIHDWHDYTGKLIDQREAEKQRSRRRRAAATSPPDRGTTAGRPEDDREKTGHRVDQTRLDKSREEKKENPLSADAEPEAKKQTAQERRFDEFWSIYPRKVGKKAALNSWKKLKPDAELFERIIQAVATAKASDQWIRGNGRFIPHPATWLNQGRWDDELDPAAPAAGNTYQASPGKVNTMDALAQIIAEEEGGTA